MTDDSKVDLSVKKSKKFAISWSGSATYYDYSSFISPRLLAWLLLLIGFTLMAFSYGPDVYHWLTNRATGNEILILLADFQDDSDNITYDAAGAIDDAIRPMLTSNLPDVRLVRLHQTFKRGDLEAVKRWGNWYNAILFIWGHYDDGGMYPRFTVVHEDEIHYLPQKLDDKIVNLAQPPNDFTLYVNRDLPTQVSYLSHFTVGQIFYLKKLYGPALDLFEKVVELEEKLNESDKFKDNLAITYLYKGYIYQVDRKDFKQAIEDYTTSVKLGFESEDLYLNRGFAYYSCKEYLKAIEDYTRAIKGYIRTNPSSLNLPLTYSYRGVVYYNTKRYLQAIEDYTQAIDKYTRANASPLSLAQIYQSRGVTYNETVDYLKAIQDYDKAIQLGLSNAEIYTGRGFAYEGLGDYSQAIRDYTQATILNPNDAVAYNNLCWTKSLHKDLVDLIDICERAVSLNPTNGFIRDSRGLARALIGDYGGAIEDFKFLVQWSRENGYYEVYGKKREEWIIKLEAGQNPFDEATLKELME